VDKSRATGKQLRRAPGQPKATLAVWGCPWHARPPPPGQSTGAARDDLDGRVTYHSPRRGAAWARPPTLHSSTNSSAPAAAAMAHAYSAPRAKAFSYTGCPCADGPVAARATSTFARASDSVGAYLAGRRTSVRSHTKALLTLMCSFLVFLHALAGGLALADRGRRGTRGQPSPWRSLSTELLLVPEIGGLWRGPEAPRRLDNWLASDTWPGSV